MGGWGVGEEGDENGEGRKDRERNGSLCVSEEVEMRECRSVEAVRDFAEGKGVWECVIVRIRENRIRGEK